MGRFSFFIMWHLLVDIWPVTMAWADLEGLGLGLDLPEVNI